MIHYIFSCIIGVVFGLSAGFSGASQGWFYVMLIALACAFLNGLAMGRNQRSDDD